MKKKTKNKVYVGIDIGGTKIAVGLVDQAGKLLAANKCPTPCHSAPGTGTRILHLVERLVRELLDEEGVNVSSLRGIGAGVPGIVRPDRRGILITPNVGLSRYPLAALLERSFKTKVVLGNDVNLGVLGEKWFGAGKGINNIVGLFPGTGVGGAIIIGGQLITGAQGAAGELGHMILDLHSSQKSAGLYGTLEALASRRAIECAIKKAVARKVPTVITKIQKGKLDTIKSQVIAEALRRKDPLTVRVMNEACHVLGQACVSLRHILNPDMIILGGGVIEACGDYMLPRIRDISAADPFFKGIDNCRIERSFLGDDAIILGAVVLLKQVLGEKITSGVDYYPKLRADQKGNIWVNGKLVRKNIYIRADGKVKKINGDAVFNELDRFRRLGISALRRVCKKGPKILIVGSSRRRLRISQEGKKFLKEHLVQTRLLDVKKAVKTYNAAKERKTMVIYRREA